MGEGTAIFDPRPQIFFCLAAQGNQALLVALANGSEPFVVQVQLRDLDAQGFRDAQPRAVHELEKGGVPKRVLAVGGTLKDAVHFFPGQVFWQVVPESGGGQHGFGAVAILLLLFHVLKESPQAGKVSRYRRGGVFRLPCGECQELIQFWGCQFFQVNFVVVEPVYEMPQVFLVALDGLGRKVPFYSQEGQVGVHAVRIQAHGSEFSIFFSKIPLTAPLPFSIIDPVQATMDD